MEPKIKLTNLWQNYKAFLDSLSMQNFEQYYVLKNWPSIIVEKTNGWKDFVYVVLLAFKDNDFAELFDGYTNEEIMGIQWAITNKYEAIESRMLSGLQGQVFMGVQFGVGYSQETKPAGNGPSPYAGQPARTMKAVPRKGGLGNVGRYVRDYKPGDEDIVVIDGQMWLNTWIKQKNWDYTETVTYAMKLKNLKTGEFMVIPNACLLQPSSDTGYSGASANTVWYPNFMGYGGYARGSKKDSPKAPYFTSEYKDWFLKKLKANEIEYDKYQRGTLSARMFTQSNLA